MPITLIIALLMLESSGKFDQARKNTEHECFAQKYFTWHLLRFSLRPLLKELITR